MYLQDTNNQAQKKGGRDMGENVKIMLASELQPEVAQVMEFMKELNTDEKKDFLSFIQGIRFAKNTALKDAKASA